MKGFLFFDGEEDKIKQGIEMCKREDSAWSELFSISLLIDGLSLDNYKELPEFIREDDYGTGYLDSGIHLREITPRLYEVTLEPSPVAQMIKERELQKEGFNEDYKWFCSLYAIQKLDQERIENLVKNLNGYDGLKATFIWDTSELLST